MKGDLISRSAIIDILERDLQSGDDTITLSWLKTWLEMQETVDAAEVLHGRWKKIAHYPYYCSVCEEIAPLDCEGESHYKSNYCPHCGAKMDE